MCIRVEQVRKHFCIKMITEKLGCTLIPVGRLDLPESISLPACLPYLSTYLPKQKKKKVVKDVNCLADGFDPKISGGRSSQSIPTCWNRRKERPCMLRRKIFCTLLQLLPTMVHMHLDAARPPSHICLKRCTEQVTKSTAMPSYCRIGNLEERGSKGKK